MHAIPLNYNDHVLVPLAAGERGSFASMVIVTKPNGARWASGVLGHFSEADDACRFAIEYGKAEVDGTALVGKTSVVFHAKLTLLCFMPS